MERNESTSSGQKRALGAPKPIKILSCNDYKIVALWNTGEIRLNDYKSHIDDWLSNPFLGPIINENEFSNVAVIDNTFGWKVPSFSFSDDPGTFYPRTIDPFLAYKQSQVLSEFNPAKQLAAIIKSERKKANLSQAELAEKVGYSSKYISKMERGISDVQFGVLEYILRVGFGKDIMIGPISYQMAA